LTRSNCEMLFTLSLLVLMIASTSIVPSVAQQARVGEIILNPTHAIPGTLVSFQGVGWYLPEAYGVGTALVCRVNGEPVRIDRHCICNVVRVSGIVEPVGTFVVADVPAGDYSIFVEIEPWAVGITALTGEAVFTVDAVTTVTTIATTTLATSVSSYTSTLTTSASPTVLTVTATATTTTRTTIPPPGPGFPDLTWVIIGILAVLIVVFAAFALRRRRPAYPPAPPPSEQPAPPTPTEKPKPSLPYCVHCGTENPPTNEYCGKCGKKLLRAS